MVKKEVIDYIHSVQNKGFTDTQIKDHLEKHGYTKDAIDEAFLQLSIKKEVPKKDFSKILIFGFIGLAVVIAAVSAIFMINKIPDGCSAIFAGMMEMDNNAPFVCALSDKSIMTMIKNSGTKNITYAKITVMGEKGSSEKELPYLLLKPGDAFPVSNLDYDFTKNGKIQEIIIAPGYMKGKNSFKCSDIKFEIKSISAC